MLHAVPPPGNNKYLFEPDSCSGLCRPNIGNYINMVREQQYSSGSCSRCFQLLVFAVASACPELTQPPSACVCQELPCDLRFTGAAVNLRAGRPATYGSVS